MSRRETDSLTERLHREYRYHPEEFRRHHLKYAAWCVFPCILCGTFASYYYHTGRPLWEGDPQHLLNLLRLADTSPRSKLYAYRLPEFEELPEHVRAYREANRGKRVEAERLFAITHSSFALPTEDDCRRLKADAAVSG